MRGLTAAGCDVVDIGLSTSPLLYFTVIDRGLGGGVNVTGSHLAPINNGFKIVSRDAYPVATEGIETIRDIALNGDFESGEGSISEYDPKPDYLARVNQPFKLARKLKVVVDTGNGVAGLLAPRRSRTWAARSLPSTGTWTRRSRITCLIRKKMITSRIYVPKCWRSMQTPAWRSTAMATAWACSTRRASTAPWTLSPSCWRGTI